MAGTTVEDAGAVAAAFAAALTAEGVDPTSSAGRTAMSYIQRTMGQSKVEVFTALFDADHAVAERANQRFEEAYAHSVATGEVRALPGAEEVIAVLRSHGIKVCLTTGFSPSTRDAVLDALGWRHTVDLALSPADCGRGRPYPDMVLHAVIALEIDDVAAVAVVGDTASDVLSGRRAGAGFAIGVLSGAHGRTELEAAEPTHVLASVAELPALLIPERGDDEADT